MSLFSYFNRRKVTNLASSASTFFVDAPESKKKKVIEQSIRDSNKEQQKIVDEYKRRFQGAHS